MDISAFDTLLDGVERARNQIYLAYAKDGNTPADREYWKESFETLKKLAAKIYSAVEITKKGEKIL